MATPNPAPIVLVLLGVICFQVPVAVSPERNPQTPTAAHVRALLDQGSYDEAEVLARKRVDAEREAHGAGSLNMAAASDLLIRALSLNGKGSLPTTLALAEETLRSNRALAGVSQLELADSLSNVGSALSETAEHTRAISILEQAVTLHERISESGTAEWARALDALGVALIRAGRYEDASRVLRRGLSIKESLGVSERELATTLQSMTLAVQRNGDYAAARVALQRALDLQSDLSPHPIYAEALNLLGLQLWFEGNLAEARDASARAVDVAERMLRPDHPTTAWLLRNLASSLFDLGDFAQARSLQERALGIVERSLGPDHHESTAYLNSLADSQMILGAYSSARLLYERALRIAQARFGQQHDFIATFVHNLGLVDARLGDYESAKREQMRALEIWELVYYPNHPIVAVPLTALASVLREQGQAQAALPLLERALAIRERRLKPDHRDTARTLADLAATLAQLGFTDRAQEQAARALRIWDDIDTPDAPDLAAVLTLYAELQAMRGDYAVARQYYEKALAIWDKALGSSHPTFADTEVLLAEALMNLGDEASALKRANDAELTGREHLRLMLRYLPERQALNYAVSRPRGLDLLFSLVGSSPAAPAIALDGLIQSRALVLDEMAGRRQDALDTTSSGVAPLWTNLIAARQRLANLVVRGPGQQRPEQYVMIVEGARRDKELAERALSEKSAAFSGELDAPSLGLEQVRAALPRGSALVSIVRYEAIKRPDVRSFRSGTKLSARPHSGPPVPTYMAFALRQGDQNPVTVLLGDATVVDSLISRWRTETVAWLTRAPGAPKSAERTLRAIGDELRRRVWDPIAAQLDGVDQVFVVPDGALNLLPLTALPVGTAHYLLESGPTLHYLSAERDLVTADSPTRGKGLLTLGGPSFQDASHFARLAKPSLTASRAGTQAAAAPQTFRGAASRCFSFQSLTFEALPASGREANEVADLWKEFGSGAADASAGPTALVGRAADERSFKQLSPGHRVLHLATHGFFLGSECASALDGTRSVGGLVARKRPTAANPKTPGPKAASRSQTGAPAGENPLLLSGLAMAGANRRVAATGDEEDGILTAEEVASLDLSGVEWAVLSACDTGLGEIRAGEGVFGLRRAFQIAGAHTVIMSLWEVEDRAAMIWMRALYKGRLALKLDTAAAVREASLAVLRARRARGQSTHPFFWAGFVASGDWR